eukprot:Hpha_TRINITY_DN4538_c0_g1::TRINITY_DN4538_c0_g1_i1::g.115501::m.115501
MPQRCLPLLCCLLWGPPAEATRTVTQTIEATTTRTVTLPSASGTRSVTRSNSQTETVEETGTETATATETESSTPSETFAFFDNYTQRIGPTPFVEGQDVRLRIETSWGGMPGPAAFNASTPGYLKVRVFTYTTSTERPSCLEHTEGSPSFGSSLLYSFDDFGIEDDQDVGETSGVRSAYITLTAPASPFFCVLSPRERGPLG